MFLASGGDCTLGRMAYQRLTGIDTAFFLAESETTPLHMLAAIMLDPSTVPGGYSFEKLRDFMAERLHLIPPLQRRGADGLSSQLRELTFGPVPLSYSGYTCWRLVVECPPGLKRGQEMWGRGKRFGILRIDDHRVYCFAVANAPAASPAPAEEGVEAFHERFAGFGGRCPRSSSRSRIHDSSATTTCAK